MYNNHSTVRDGGVFNMPRSRVNQAACGNRGDIPPAELTNRTAARRRCDGSIAENEIDGFPNATSCGISCTGWGLTNHPVAMVYSPCQPWNNVYKPEIALERGTVFKDLDLPLEAVGRKGGMCQ